MGCYHSTPSIDLKVSAAFHRTPAGRLAGSSPWLLPPSSELISDDKPWDLGLSSVLSATATSLRRRRLLRHRRRRAGKGGDSENNKSWLLAEAGAAVAPESELRTVRSSFRFSFGSASEMEEIFGVPARPSSKTTLLLLFDLDDLRERRKKLQRRRLEALERSISSAVGGALVRFSYAEIQQAAKGFNEGRELGRALSQVYKGRIGVMRRAVAIKRVDGNDKESVKNFYRELIIASSLRNPNIVPLIGFCVDAEGLFLVYKYVSGGSLDQHLHDHDKKRKSKVLSWKARYKVALGIARALEYLHFGHDKCVIHRDIKPSNILISSKGIPKLCDFGLATYAHGPSLSFLCKAVKGTFGYLAPEYFQHGKLSDKTDIYAFGVVLLELITGRKAIDRDRPHGEENLVLWAKPYLQQGEEAILKLVDPRLKPGRYNQSEILRFAHAATACVKSEESGRPNISQVIAMLQGDVYNGDWSVFVGSNRFTRNGSQSHEPSVKSDMKGYLALAMLGVSDNEGDESHGR